MPISISEQIKCVEREISYRNYVYPNLVLKGKMTEKQKNLEIERMKAVYETLINYQRTHAHLLCNQQPKDQNNEQ